LALLLMMAFGFSPVENVGNAHPLPNPPSSPAPIESDTASLDALPLGHMPPTQRVDIVLRRGDSLDVVLARQGIDANQRQAVEDALRDSLAFRDMRPGSHILLTLGRAEDGSPQLIALHADLIGNADATLLADEGGTFAVSGGSASGAAKGNEPLRMVAGQVDRGLKAALLHAGVPAAVEREVADALLYDPDLPANPPSGSQFQVLYSSGGALHRVTMTIRGRTHSVYRYPVGAGLVAFVGPSGKGVVHADLAVPVRDARVSSPWGWRIHPVLDRPEFHKGIDLAAPEGTPVVAAADGVVAQAGWHGNYGLLVKVQHAPELETSYGHLAHVAHGLHVGTPVKKGQVIGYVGQTGLSTGPHLYFEVYVAGTRVNPAKKTLAAPISLAGAKLRGFRQMVLADRRSAAD
jgi:murein DD-endopeptidase MepM/ murein hydrolase activator NlpD